MKPGYIIVLTNLSLWLLMEAFAFWPQLFYVFLALANALLILAVYYLMHQGKIRRGWWNFWILPFLFLNGVIAYGILIPQDFWLNKVFLQLLFVLVVGFNFSYFKNAYEFCFHPERPNNLAGLSSNFNFLSWFFALSAIYGLQLFLGLPYWILILVLVALALLSTYQNLWVNGLKTKENSIFIFLSAFIIAQLAWSAYFLPFDYNSLGLLIALSVYVILNLIRFYLSHNWNKKNLRSLLIFSGAIMLLLLLTVRWR